MKPTPTGTGTPAHCVASQRYVIPTIHGDPAAAYRLADAYRELADAIMSAQRRTIAVIGSLSHAWRGVGHHALDAPVEAFVTRSSMVATALRNAADELDDYGHRLATAHHHHGFSLHKLLVVGAIVAVSAVAIVVTVGVAGAVEAAAATAAVGGTIEAAGAAGAADLAAAGGIDAALDGMGFVRPLLAFVVDRRAHV